LIQLCVGQGKIITAGFERLPIPRAFEPWGGRTKIIGKNGNIGNSGFWGIGF
jgi:hypothetical protein